MKKVKSKFYFIAMVVAAVSTLGLGSCSKSNNNSGGGGTTPPTGPTPINGYVSSDSVAAGSLVSYWPFDGNVNDKAGGLTGTAVGVTFTTGIRGQAYQGAAGAYATLTPGAGLDSLHSYSFSVWYKLATQPADGDPAGIFFLSGTTNLNLLIHEIEHYSPVSGDSVKVHHGFTNPGSAGWQGFTMESYDTAAVGKWIHWVTTYDGTSSVYTIYENGVPVGNSSAWSNGLYVTPTTMYSDGTATGLQGPISFATDLPKTIYLGTWPPTLYGVSPTLGSNGCFEGQMDELRVYNKALSAAEVSGLYGNGAAGR